MFRNILLVCIFLIVGVLSGLGVILVMENSSLPFDNPALVAMGVKKPEIVGFLPYWLLKQADKDYSQYITTLTYFGLALQSDGSIKKLNTPQEEEPGWTILKRDAYASRMTDAKNHGLKQSLLVISGDDNTIGDIIGDPVAHANTLMQEIAPIMKDKGFTDLNLDIESFIDASESARTNFTTFVSTVKNQLVAQNLGTLTLDLIPIALVKTKLYDARSLGSIVDRVVLMTYDYHYIGSLTSGANAPIDGAGTRIEYDTKTAVQEAIKAIPKEKILLGVPLYGYEWETLSNASESATIPGGSSTASSRRVADILSSCASCSAQFDPVAREPYLIYPEQDYYNQIYFENESSMKEKINLAKTYQLGGIALWALGYEDATMLRPLTDYKNTPSLVSPN